MIKRKVVAFDLETHTFSPGNMAPKPVCLSWAADTKYQLNKLIPARKILDWIIPKLEEAIAGDIVLVGQNVAYDFAVLHEHFPEIAPLIWEAYEADGVSDTMLRERLLDIAQGKLRGAYGEDGLWRVRMYSLADLSKRYLDIDLTKGAESWGLRYKELDGVPIRQWPDGAKKYAIYDSICAYSVFISQQDRATKMRYTMPTEYEEARAAFALNLTSVWGIRTDRERVQSLWDYTQNRMDELQQILIKEGLMSGGAQGDLFGEPARAIKSISKIRDKITQCFPEGQEIPTTKKGAVKTGKEVMELCNDPTLDALIEFNSLQKSGSTFIRALFDGTEWPIHARFSAIGAASDRTSCSSPNLQNQPRLPGVRECFKARPGRSYVACDFDAQEMRTLAQSCVDIVGKSKLAERFQKDVHYDPHQEFADNHGGSRQHAKIANFGLPGGMGEYGLIRYAKGYGVSLTVEEATKLRAAWLRQWPEMDGYFRNVSAIVGQAGVGNVCVPQSGFVRGLCGYTDASNTFFQTLAAHASKAALFQVAKRCYAARNSWLYGCRPVNFIHDEIIIEAFDGYEHEAAAEMEQVMIEAMNRWTPSVPASASATAMTHWSKKAKQVFDKDGRLVPWTINQEK